MDRCSAAHIQLTALVSGSHNPWCNAQGAHYIAFGAIHRDAFNGLFVHFDLRHTNLLLFFFCLIAHADIFDVQCIGVEVPRTDVVYFFGGSHVYIEETALIFAFLHLEDIRTHGQFWHRKEARNIFGYNSTLEKEHFWGHTKSLFSGGLQVRYDDVNDVELSRTKNRTEITEALSLGDVNELNTGLYAEEKLLLNKKLDVTVGLRGDFFSNRYANKLDGTTLSSTSFIVSPKLHFDYRPQPNVHLYWHNGQGFHSNDTRVAVQKNGREVVTPAWGSDLGAMVKIGNRLVVQGALWYLFMRQEFVFVGDEGVVEPGGRTRRLGWDASVRYELAQHFFADLNVNYAMGRAVDEPKEANRIPLAPIFTSTGGITYRKAQGLNGSIRYRYM
ncbi:MAG: TonB-dependent receptor, partial [Flavobacteriia bacterium]